MCKQESAKLLLLSLLFLLLLSRCGEPIYQPQGMLDEKLDCPEGSYAEIERWGGVGENRWLQSCKMKHGTFIGWYNEAKLVEGGYRNGKKEGVWRVWSDDGQLIKEITYRGNKEVTVKEYKLGATD